MPTDSTKVYPPEDPNYNHEEIVRWAEVFDDEERARQPPSPPYSETPSDVDRRLDEHRDEELLQRELVEQTEIDQAGTYPNTILPAHDSDHDSSECSEETIEWLARCAVEWKKRGKKKE